MSRRRRWGIALGLGFVLVVIAVVGFGSRGDEREVKLIFHGYTNVIVHARDTLPDFRTAYQYETRARLLITNAGSVPVILHAELLAAGMDQGSANLSRGIPVLIPMLKPQTGRVVEFDYPMQGSGVQIEVAYSRVRASRRLADRLYYSSNPFIKKMARTVMSQPTVHHLTLELPPTGRENSNDAPSSHPVLPVPLNMPAGPQ